MRVLVLLGECDNVTPAQWLERCRLHRRVLQCCEEVDEIPALWRDTRKWVNETRGIFYECVLRHPPERTRAA